MDICKKISNELKNSIFEYNEIEMKYNSKRNRKNKWNRAFEMMNKEKEINSEEINSLLESFEGNRLQSNEKSNSVSNEMKGAIDWYCTYCLQSKKVNLKSR